MDYLTSPEFARAAARVNFDYYRKNVNPDASLKEFYQVRLQAHRELYLTKPFAHVKVEIWRCQLILEAMEEREKRGEG